MKREEILEESRKENVGRDLYEKEVMREGGEAGIWAVYIAAALFCMVSLAVNGRAGHDLWAMAHSLIAVGYTVKLKTCREKCWQDIVLAAVVWGAVLLNAAVHFRTLFFAL